MSQALARELTLRQTPASAETLYFGGGTPSLLGRDDLGLLMETATAMRKGERWLECTLEANPEDVTPDRCAAWKELGINRLSIGVQTFDDQLLRWMNRQHTGQQASEAIRTAADAGFDHITADLIYGLPGRSAADWATDVSQMLALPIDHLSAYILTIEPRTVLGHRVQQGIDKGPDDDEVSTAYEILCDQTRSRGFDHYEVSNFAQPGAKAVHNSRYWAGSPYLGIGPGAHGFDGAHLRWANAANNPQYVRKTLAAHSVDDLPATVEVLSDADRYNETLMTGLRTAMGIDLEALERDFQRRPDLLEPEAWFAALNSGQLIEREDGRVRIAEKAWLIGDSIAGRLFDVGLA